MIDYWDAIYVVVIFASWFKEEGFSKQRVDHQTAAKFDAWEDDFYFWYNSDFWRWWGESCLTIEIDVSLLSVQLHVRRILCIWRVFNILAS